MGWLITLAVLFLLAVLPLGVSVKYNADGPLVRVIAGPLKITVFPLPKKLYCFHGFFLVESYTFQKIYVKMNKDNNLGNNNIVFTICTKFYFFYFHKAEFDC